MDNVVIDDGFVLVLEDKDSNQLSAVTNIDKEGTIETKEIKPKDTEESIAFFDFKENSSFFKLFLHNFSRQFKNPSRFSIFKVSKKSKKEDIENIKSYQKDKNLSSLTNNIRTIDINDDGICSSKIQDSLQEITDRDMRKFCKQLEEIGVDINKMRETGELDKIRRWGKSDLQTFYVDFNGSKVESKGRFALRTNDKGEIGLCVFSYREKPNLNYKGVDFSKIDHKELLHSGNLGKIVNLKKSTGEEYPCYVSIDSQTNELVCLDVNKVDIPTEILGKKLDAEEYKSLKEGKSVYVKDLVDPNTGKNFNCSLQVNAEKKGIEFIFDPSLSYKQRYEQRKQRLAENREEHLKIIENVKGVKLNNEQKELLLAGKDIFLSDMLFEDKNNPDSGTFWAYVSYDKDSKKLKFKLDRNSNNQENNEQLCLEKKNEKKNIKHKKNTLRK